MSFYWRWVVTRTAVAVPAMLCFELAAAYSEWNLGIGPASRSVGLAYFLAVVPAIFAEAFVLRRRFANLPFNAYIVYSLLGIALFSVLEVSGVLSDDGPLFSSAVSGADAVAEPSGIQILLGLSLAIAMIPIFVISIFLPWRAIGQVATGRATWRVTLLLGLLGSILATFVVAGLAGVDITSLDYSTWTNVSVQYASNIAGELTYALISGIGVARLRPIPEGTS